MSFTIYIKEKDGKFFYSANKGIIDQKFPDNIKTRADVMQYFKSSDTPIEFIGITNQPIRQYKVYSTPGNWPYYKNLTNGEGYNIPIDESLKTDQAAIREYIIEKESAKGYEPEIQFSTNE